MKILGIEFGSRSLKGVELESRFRRLDLIDTHEVRLPLQFIDPTAAYKQAVEQLMARLPEHPDKIVTSMPPTQVALRFLNLPVKNQKQVEKMYRFELEDSVPFKLDDAIMEHSITRTKDGSLVFVAIAPKRNIQSHLEWLKSIGLDPDWLTFDGMGAINVYLSTLNPKQMPSGPVALIDLGHLKTNLAIFDQDRLEFCRSLTWGGFAITESISSGLSITLDEAEAIKEKELSLEAGQGKAEELRDLARFALTSLSAELSHSFVTYRNLYKKQVSSAIFTGGTSRLRGLGELLSQNLNFEIATLRAPASVSNRSEKKIDAPELAEVLGRSMVFTRKVRYLFNFRQQEAGKATSLNEIATFVKDPNVILLSRFAALLVVILFVHQFVSGIVGKKEVTASSEELKKVFTGTFPSVPTKAKAALTSSPKELKKFIDQKNQELDQKLKLVTRSKASMLSMIKNISSSFPSALKVDVNSLRIDDKSFEVEGVLYAGDLTVVAETLKATPHFAKVALERNGQRFTIKGEITGR